MGDAFPTTGIFRRGYGKDAVDEFFIDARHAYEGGLPAEQFSAEQVRQASFPRQRNGYDTQAVDAAMSRLEAAFVQRDRADHIAVNGEGAWYEKVADRATTLYPRLLRPYGQRFSHPRSGIGYNAEQVDDLLDQIAAFFDDREDLVADDVRHTLFKSARGKKAYAMGPVDAYLGRAVEILLSVN